MFKFRPARGNSTNKRIAREDNVTVTTKEIAYKVTVENRTFKTDPANFR